MPPATAADLGGVLPEARLDVDGGATRRLEDGQFIGHVRARGQDPLAG